MSHRALSVLFQWTLIIFTSLSTLSPSSSRHHHLLLLPGPRLTSPLRQPQRSTPVETHTSLTDIPYRYLYDTGLFGDDQTDLFGDDQLLSSHRPSDSYGCHTKSVTLGPSHPQSSTPISGLLASSEGTRHDDLVSIGSRELLRSFLRCWEESGNRAG